AMGIGIETAPVLLPDGRQLLHNGQAVFTTPDFTTLEDVARATGGAFVQSNAASNDIAGLYTEIRSTIESVAREFAQRETWREAFVWPLALAVLFLVAAGWIGEGRRRFGAATAVLLAMGLVATSPALAGPLEDADAKYREGAFEAAAEELTRLSLEQPGDVDVLNRLGAARYRSGDFDGAARAFDEAAQLSDDPDLLFNSGNAHYRAGRLERALERFDDAVEDTPSHRSARKNRDLVQQEIERRRQIQPPPPPQPQPQPQPQNADEQETQPDDRQEQEPQEGPPQPGGAPPPDPSDPEAEGEPPEGPDDPGTSEAVDPDELEEQAEQEPSDAGGIDPDDAQEGPISEGQAHRLLDSIEEGSQRVQVRGRSGGKPW
ncbi:MAG: tetratricopeptide repeat protein, partial [Myxococcota bacterium]